MDELRWLLLIVGLLVVVLVYGYGRVQEWRDEGPPWRRRQKSEPFADEAPSNEDVDDTLTELDTLISEHQEEVHEPGWADSATGVDDPNETRTAQADEDSAAPAQTVSRQPEPREGRLASLLGARTRESEPEVERELEAQSRNSGEEKIVVINLVATPEGERFAGPQLVQALEAAGMRYGERQIFHRLQEAESGSSVLFSVANILEPGWFDLEQIASFDTPGVAFFMRLPGPYNGLATFEQMLATAREVAERLGGHLLDGRRCGLTQQSIEHIREDLIEYRRRAHLAARQAR